MRKLLRVTAISVLTLLSLLVVEAFVVQPAFADTVSTSKPTPVTVRINGKKRLVYRTNFNVTNDGKINDPALGGPKNDTHYIYDFHIGISMNVKILGVSRPKGWRIRWSSKSPWEASWKTSGRRAILPGSTETGFDILTDQSTYTVSWYTTDKNGKTIDQGSFNVSP